MMASKRRRGGRAPAAAIRVRMHRDLLSELIDAARGDNSTSKSTLLSLLVISEIAADRSARLSTLSERTGMSVSAVHRYVKALTAAGVIERDPATRAYRLVK